MEDARVFLNAAQAGLRSRFDDFTGALDRRDAAAYRLALADFHDWLCRWTAAEEAALLPALSRARLADRDARRELTLEYVQLRELTRNIRMQVDGAPRMADVLGFVENLSRRLAAHERGNLTVYYPAAADHLTESERQILKDAARGC